MIFAEQPAAGIVAQLNEVVCALAELRRRCELPKEETNNSC